MEFYYFACKYHGKNDIFDIFKQHNVLFVGYEPNVENIKIGDIVVVKRGNKIISISKAISNGKDLKDLAKEYNIKFTDTESDRFSYEDNENYGVKVDIVLEDNTIGIEYGMANNDKRFSRIIKEDIKQKIYHYINSKTKEQDMQEKINILKQKKQIILQGAPGTGKTYLTPKLAVELIDGSSSEDRVKLMKRYQDLVQEERIFFTTFHQSMDYEEFVEGYKPNDNAGFERRDGIFKKACEKALTAETGKIGIDDAMEKFYDDLKAMDLRDNDQGQMTLQTSTGIEFYIYLNENDTLKVRTSQQQTPQWHPDSLKRYYEKTISGGVSAYFYPIIKYMEQNYNLIDKGELDKQGISKNSPIVLIIDEINRGNISKILGELITLLEVDKRTGEINEVKAELPYSNKPFSVPPNLYIIGTMNTADRTISYIDYALRRRFAFITIGADVSAIKNDKARTLFIQIRDNIVTRENLVEEFEVEDLMIGHSYFIVNDEQELKIKLKYEIKPLLLEYLKDGILINNITDNTSLKDQIKNLSI